MPRVCIVYSVCGVCKHLYHYHSHKKPHPPPCLTCVVIPCSSCILNALLHSLFLRLSPFFSCSPLFFPPCPRSILLLLFFSLAMLSFTSPQLSVLFLSQVPVCTPPSSIFVLLLFSFPVCLLPSPYRSSFSFCLNSLFSSQLLS